MFAEGQKGADAFFDHVASKQTETLDTMSGTVADLFKVADGEVDLTNLNNLSGEQFADLADKLGMSDQMLAAMLNKAKQFYDIDFSNVDVLREALATSESTVTGIGKTGDNTNLYTKESTFRAEAEAQNYTPTEIADLKETLTTKGVKLVKDAKDINTDDMKDYINGMGIKTGEQFVDKFSKLGFSREDLQSLYKDYGNLEGMKSEDGQTFSQMYSDYLKTQETANLEPDAKAANELETTNSILTGILAAVGGISLGAGKEELNNVRGGKGTDTAVQRFGHGLNASGNEFSNEQEYNAARKALEAERNENQRIIDGLNARKNELSGAEKKSVEEDIAAYEKANKIIDYNLQQGEKKYQQLLEEKAAQDEKNKSKEKEKDLDTTTDTTTQADKTLEIPKNLQAIKDAQDALKTNGFNINEAFGLKDGQVSQASLQFGNIINTLKQSGVEVQNLGSALQGLGPGGLEKLNDADLGQIINSLKLTQEQADAINALNPNLQVTATADTSAADEAVEEVEQKTAKPKILEVVTQAVNNAGQVAESAARQASKNSQQEGSQQVTKKLEVSYVTTITNEGEITAYLDSRISAIVKNAQSTKNLKLNASVTVDYKKGKQAKADRKSATVDYKKGKQEDAKDQKAKVNYVRGSQEGPKSPKTAQVNYELGTQAKPKDKHAKVIYDEAAKGKNNRIIHQSLPTFNSLAVGNVKKQPYTSASLGNGLTLTGEKGFEIAWLPSENRSMILGANGPQMVNLPRDAVVWTNEQSKKILKQKAIPAQSMATGYTASGKFSYGSSNTTTQQTTQKVTQQNNKDTANNNKATANNNKATKKVIKQAGKVYVWWENQARKVDGTQRKVDKLLKTFEKELKEVGKTASGIKSTTTSYKKQLKESIRLNKQSETQAKKELSNLASKKSNYSISYQKTTKTKKGKTKKETVNGKVNLAGYISYDSAHDTYVINQNALDKAALGYRDSKNKWHAGNKSRAEAIKKLAEEKINDKLSKRNTARDNITKAQDALEKLSNDIYENFYRWEKSITQVYVLTQKLETISKKISIAGAQADLQFAKLEAGIGSFSDSLPKIQQALQNERTQLLQQTTGKKSFLEASLQEFKDSLDFTAYAKKYLNSSDSTEARDDYKAASLAFGLLNELQMDSNNFDYNKAIQELNNKQYNEETNNQIKAVLDKIFEKQNNFLDAEEDAYKVQTEIYEKMEEYQSFISDFEQDLISGVDELKEDEINKLEKINSSLSQAYKDLIDEVKRKLDERRKQEDNAKTESDISKKQQRLAALRADTSGGHQVEIAQLEKEIADAQQDYQRSLEDQLLDRLQQQGDEAEKQRQRQIDLLEAAKEIAQQTGTNLEEVKKWLENPEANIDKIREAWLAQQGYNEATPNQQKQIEEQFNVEWSKYTTYFAELPEYQKAATDSLLSLEESVDSIAKQMPSLNKNQRSTAWMKENKFTAGQLKKLGYSAQSLSDAGYTNKQIHDAGYTAAQFKAVKGNRNIKTAIAAGYTPQQAAKAYGATAAMTTANMSGAATQKATKASAKTLQTIVNKSKTDKAVQKDMAGVQVGKVDVNGKTKGGIIKDSHISAGGGWVGANSGSTLYIKDWDEKTGKVKSGAWGKIPISKLTTTHLKNYPIDAKQALIYAIQHTKVGSKINGNFKSLVTAAGIVGKYYKLNNSIYGSIGSDGRIYYNDGKKGVQIWNAASGKIVLDKYKKADFIKKAKYKNVGREYASVLKANGVKGYSTGGIADYTGPAWLHGTPSKPELVLNATDTKNFLALKDVLSKAITSTDSIENSYGGDTNFEVNINVDHLNNDYDVDKVADRVRKIIVKDAGYRNVTQVRNFR